MIRQSDRAAPQRLRQGGATSADERAAAKLIQGAPLPPADSLTVRRIWQRVVSATEPGASARSARSRYFPLLAPSLALVTVLALGLVVLRLPARRALRAAPLVIAAPAAELAAAQGGVFAARPAEIWQPVTHGAPLAKGQFVRTDPGGQAVMDVSGIASIVIAPGTEVFIDRLEGGTVLHLSRGSVVARVSKRPANEPFVIATRSYSVRVVGTLFQVDQDENDRTSVTVREGVVEVTGPGGRSWRVPAGQAWSSNETSPSPSSSRPALPVADAPRAAPLRAADTRPPVPDSSGQGGVPNDLPPIVLALSDAAPAPTPGAYADGVALEHAGKIRAAAETFSQVEKSDPAHAALALYALGRLRQHRLQDPQGALEAFEAYRTRYPSGPLLPEVDLAILEIDAAAGHRDQALAESVRFLASHPTSERIVEIHLLRGDLLRERGDCRSALPEYRQAESAAFAEDALFETAYCQRKLGDADAAHQSLLRYRQRYPAGKHHDEVDQVLRE